MKDTAQMSKTPKRDRFFRKIREVKSFLYLVLHRWFYWFLFKIGLGWKFSKWLCSIGRYKKFSNGRCMYCGGTHERLWYERKT